MRIVFFSDLHAHAFAEFGADERLNDCLSVLTDIRVYCNEHKITNVFFGGDLFHVRGVVKTAPYVRVANELRAFKDDGISFFAADGNHDHEDKAGTTHALQPLMSGRLLTGIGKRGWRVVRVGGVDVAMFAYCEGAALLAKRIQAALKHCNNERKRAHRSIALFHHGFKGARVGSVLEHEVKEPIDARKLKLSKLFDLVLSGHYHSHQQIVGVKNGWYIGSPLEHTRSDCNEEPKGFLVVDTKTMTFERVPLKRPRFVTLNADGNVKDWPEVVGNFVDVVYAKAPDDSFDALLAELRQLGARGINPVALPQAKRQMKKRLNVSPALAPRKVLRRYVKHKRKSIKRQQLDRTALLRLGTELLRDAEK